MYSLGSCDIIAWQYTWKKHDVYFYKILLEYIFLEPQGHAEEPGEELEKY